MGEMVKYFKFLNFWAEKCEFHSIVENYWNTYIQGNAMRILQQKLKIMAKNMSYWSTNNIGYIHDKVREMEQLTKQKYDEYECDNSDEEASISQSTCRVYNVAEKARVYTQA